MSQSCVLLKQEVFLKSPGGIPWEAAASIRGPLTWDLPTLRMGGEQPQVNCFEAVLTTLSQNSVGPQALWGERFFCGPECPWRFTIAHLSLFRVPWWGGFRTSQQSLEATDESNAPEFPSEHVRSTPGRELSSSKRFASFWYHKGRHRSLGVWT